MKVSELNCTYFQEVAPRDVKIGDKWYSYSNRELWERRMKPDLLGHPIPGWIKINYKKRR